MHINVFTICKILKHEGIHLLYSVLDCAYRVETMCLHTQSKRTIVCNTYCKPKLSVHVYRQNGKCIILRMESLTPKTMDDFEVWYYCNNTTWDEETDSIPLVDKDVP